MVSLKKKCCCGGGGEPDPCGCELATAKAAGFTFTVSGIDVVPSNPEICFCDSFNGTFCLPYVGSCNWFKGEGILGECPPFSIYWWLQANCSDDQPCTATLNTGYWAFGGGPSLVGRRVYTCSAFSCTTGGTFTRVGPEDDTTGTICGPWPDEIEVTASTECEETPAGCACQPKSSYSPRVTVSGLADDSCESCSCVPSLDLCFEPYGEDDTDCQWICDFTLPSGDPIECTSNATYAILNTYDGSDVTLKFYDSGDSVVASYSLPLTSFECDAAGMPMIHVSDSDTCAWPTDFGAVLLSMHGEECGSCLCDDELYAATVIYDSVEYEICCLVEGCSGTSNVMPIGGGDGLRVKIDFGTAVAPYARLFVWFVPSSGPEVLIGIYNYLSDISTFECDDSNTVYLASGNPGQCGSDVDEDGTDLLNATATIGLYVMPTCDGTPMPDTVTVAISDELNDLCECKEATAELYYDCITGKWVGELLCDPPGAGGEFYMSVQFYMTGSGASSGRLYIVWNDGCDSDVTLTPTGSPTCGAIEFEYVAGDGSFSVTW